MCHSRVSSIRGPCAAQIPFPLGPFGTGGLTRRSLWHRWPLDGQGRGDLLLSANLTVSTRRAPTTCRTKNRLEPYPLG